MRVWGGSRIATPGCWEHANQWVLVLGFLLGCFSSVMVWQERSLTAEPQGTGDMTNNPLPSEPPLDLNALKPGQTPPGVVTANTISSTHIMVPSLWWVQEQIASDQKFNERFGKSLTLNWLAYPIDGRNAGRVDLVVDRQIWGSLDYLERYGFVNHFSAVARSYGYNTRVFDSQARIVAASTCGFSNLDLRLLQLSAEFSGIPLLQPETSNYSRSPIADQLSCNIAVETGISSFFRRNSMDAK